MKVKIGGKDATKYVGAISFSFDDEVNGAEMSFSSIVLYDIGSTVKVIDNGTKFLGIIVSMEENHRPPHSYKAIDFSFNMKSDQIIQFKNLEASKAITKLLDDNGIESDCCSIPTKITKIYKDNIISIIKDILEEAKKDQGKEYFFEVDGSKVVVEEKKKIKIKPTFLVADDAPISRSIEELKNEVQIAKENEILATATDGKSQSKLGTLRTVVDADATKAKAQSMAESELKSLNRVKNSKQLNLLVSKGYWDIKKNRLIKLKGGGLNGWYRIQSASHTIDGSTHKVSIEVEWNAKQP